MALWSILQLIFTIVEGIIALIAAAYLLWRVYCARYRPPPLAPPPPPAPAPVPSRAPAHSPLHPALIQILPTSTYSSSTTTAAAEGGEQSHPPQECSICLIEFKEGDIGRVFPNCDHFFHLACIDKWLRTRKTCPLCREVVNLPRRI